MANANWSNPTLTSTYTNFVSEVKNRDEDLALQFDGTTSTNLITNTIRWDSSANRWKKWNGSAWVELTSGYVLNSLTVTGSSTLASPSLTGTPTVPTAAADTNTTQAASTAFVVGQAGTDTPTSNGTAAVGTSLRYSRQDHVHPSDTTRAPLASPTFTGTVAIPTGAVGTPSLYFTGDVNTGFWSPGADQLAFSTSGTQRLTIDASGRTLIGGSTIRAVGGTTLASLSVETTGLAFSLVRNSADTNPSVVSLGKSRATTLGGVTAVAEGDILGEIRFSGANGTDLSSIGAHIRAVVDAEVGTAGDTSDMPTRLAFSTTPDGAATATERLRITNSGTIFCGNGETATTPSNSTIAATGGSGTNKTGATLTIQGGKGTGTGAGGPIVFSTAAAGSSGTVLNAASERCRVDDAGRLLIGTTTANTSGNALLQVNGSIQGTITIATAVASTSGTAIDFTSIPTWVKRITVMFDGVSTNGTNRYLVQVGTSSGYVNTGYTSGAGTGANYFSSTAGFAITENNSASTVIFGNAIICNISSNSWVLSSTTVSSADSRLNVGAGSVALSGGLDRVRITTVNGTDAFDAGTINIMYEG